MTAWEEGYDAFLKGEGDHENPYRYENLHNEMSWIEGWCAAARDHEEGR